MIEEISFSNVSKTYPGGVVALKNVSLTIPSGKVIAFIGANGSGKTTALKLLSGQLQTDSGSISFLGLDPQRNNQKMRKIIGYTAQNVGLDNEITGLEALSLFASLYGINGTKKKDTIHRLIDEFGLDEHINRQIRSYSGGMAQRLHLALSVIHDPKYLLLDEPTNSLDPAGKHDLWEKLINFDHKLIVIVTHDLQEAAKYCDHVVLFHKGKILTDGSPDEIVEQDKSIQLQITYDGKLKDEFKKDLDSLPGLNRVSINHTDLLLSISADKYNDQAVYNVFEKYGINIIETRVHQPDLFTAYFNLTGQTPSSKPGKKNKGGKGK